VKYGGAPLSATDIYNSGSFSIYLKYAATTQTFPPFNFLYPNKITLDVISGSATDQTIVVKFYSFLNPGTIIPYLISGCSSVHLNGAALSGNAVGPFTEITYQVISSFIGTIFFDVSGGLPVSYNKPT
jgi:hypothetical protein